MSRCGNVINCGPRSPTTLAEVFLVTKTTRRGSFFASELTPVSILFFSIVVLGFDGETPVLLHAPEMNADQYEGNERENHDVKHIEAQQSVFSNDIAAEKQETYLVSDERHGGNDVGADGDRPEGKLVPRQQVPGIAQEEGDEKQDDADDPVKFVGG